MSLEPTGFCWECGKAIGEMRLGLLIFGISKKLCNRQHTLTSATRINQGGRMIKLTGELIQDGTQSTADITKQVTIALEDFELLTQLKDQNVTLFGHTIQQLTQIVRAFDFPGT